MNTHPLSPAIFRPAVRINRSLTAELERRILHWIAQRTPLWISSDSLTALGLAAQCGAGISFALAPHSRWALPSVVLCIVLNWLGDSLDGTLARVRSRQRPRYGFYVDHVVDMLGAIALMCGLGFSGTIHWPVAAAMLVGFLLLAGESYLASYTLARFELSTGIFGPTEIRLLLIAGTLKLIRSPYVTILGHQLLLFDLGGAIASAAMFFTALRLAVRHTAELYRHEPLP